jgi:hypothetical protein
LQTNMERMTSYNEEEIKLEEDYNVQHTFASVEYKVINIEADSDDHHASSASVLQEENKVVEDSNRLLSFIVCVKSESEEGR